MKPKKTLTELVLKLPAWAQKHIQHINGLRLRAEFQLQDFLDSQTPSKVYVRVPCEDTKFFIQTDRVVFELADGRTITVELEADKVNVSGQGFGSLAILPHVSNVVSVKFTE